MSVAMLAQSEDPAMVEQLRLQLVLSRASELARAGRLDQADLLLEPLPRTPARLDLQARIQLQRGAPERARALWLELLDQAPTHEAATRALAALPGSAARPSVGGWPRFGMLAALGVCVALAFLLHEVHTQEQRVAQSLRAQSARQEELLAQLSSEVTRAVSAAAAPVAPAPLRPSAAGASDGSPPTLEVPGFTATAAAGYVSLAPQVGLFTQGTRLRPEAYRLLSDLGLKLATLPGEPSLELVGHTDAQAPGPDAGHRDNPALGMQRANVVFQYLSTCCGLKSARFRLRTAGGEPGPFQPATDVRNRSVSVRYHLEPQ